MSDPSRHPLDLTPLPADFVWGAATAAFQIEGDAANRGDSIWDAMCREPGRIRDGSDGTVACDHVHRYRDDLHLMRDLGIGAYRFSISWPRVQPGGAGPISATGMDFYDRLVDSLLDAGIDPWVTLYHWDLPTELQQADGPQGGGWAGRDVVDRFTDYAVAMHTAFGDRVRHWTTFNEPWCASWLGYGSGIHAPGIADHAQATRAAHHLLLAHGRAVTAIRAQATADHRVGIVLNLTSFRPAAGLDRATAAQVARSCERMDGLQNRWWLDALFLGRYPADMLELLAPYLDGVIHDGDPAEIAQPLDYLGVNYYSDQLMEPNQLPLPDNHGTFPFCGSVTNAPPGPDVTSIGWPVTPGGLTETLLRVGTEYPNAPYLVVTENGSAYDDDPDALVAAREDAGAVIDDPKRVSYLERHLEALARAVAQGADVRGYFAWSLLDNFEWAEGYSQRFGLVRVEFDEGQERRPRRSFEVYRDAVRSRTSA